MEIIGTFCTQNSKYEDFNVRDMVVRHYGGVYEASIPTTLLKNAHTMYTMES